VRPRGVGLLFWRARPPSPLLTRLRARRSLAGREKSTDHGSVSNVQARHASSRSQELGPWPTGGPACLLSGCYRITDGENRALECPPRMWRFPTPRLLRRTCSAGPSSRGGARRQGRAWVGSPSDKLHIALSPHPESEFVVPGGTPGHHLDPRRMIPRVTPRPPTRPLGRPGRGADPLFHFSRLAKNRMRSTRPVV